MAMAGDRGSADDFASLPPTSLVLPKLTDRDFERLRGFLEQHLGMRLPESKKSMLEARLMRRLRALQIPSFARYVDLFFSPGNHEEELEHVVDLATTHHTYFFREDEHLYALTDRLVPDRLQRGSHVAVWSAGCSTGEEAYSIAMLLEELRRTRAFTYSILGTDVSQRVLRWARRAVYGDAAIEAVPEQLARRYFMRSKDRARQEVRVVPELRRHVTFAPLNLSEPYQLDAKIDVAFLRNVLIYFDAAQSRVLLRRLCDQLVPGGYLLLSLTESAEGMGLPLEVVGRSIYRRLP